MRKFKHPLGEVKELTEGEAETLLRIQGKRKGWEEVKEKEDKKLVKRKPNTGDIKEA